jgi:phosphate-selective porin OprO/OprP
MKTVLIGLLCLLFASMPAIGDDLSIEERLKKLEQEVSDLKKENAQLRQDLGVEVVARQASVKVPEKADVKAAAKVDVKPAGSENALQLGGLLQTQSEAGDRGDSRFSDSNARFFLRRVRVNASGRFAEGFDFRAELELAGSLSNTSAFRAQLTDGYVNWNRFGAANVRVGQFKTPFGYEQLYSDSRLPTAERSLVNDRLTSGRQIGVQVAGEADHKRLTYAAGIFNGSGTNQNFNDNDKFMTAARVSFVPFSGHLLGNQSRWSVGANGIRTTDSSIASAADFGFDSSPSTPAKDNLFVGRRTGIGYDSQLEVGPFALWGEYLRGTFEPTDRLPLSRLRSSGWYGMATWFVIADKLQVVGRLETFDPNNNVAGNATRATILGANWYLRQHDLKLQLDWMRSAVPGLSKDQQKIIARMQAVF